MTDQTIWNFLISHRIFQKKTTTLWRYTDKNEHFRFITNRWFVNLILRKSIKIWALTIAKFMAIYRLPFFSADHVGWRFVWSLVMKLMYECLCLKSGCFCVLRKWYNFHFWWQSWQHSCRSVGRLLVAVQINNFSVWHKRSGEILRRTAYEIYIIKTLFLVMHLIITFRLALSVILCSNKTARENRTKTPF